MLGDLFSSLIYIYIYIHPKNYITKLIVLKSCDFGRFSIAIIQPKFKKFFPDFLFMVSIR
jgi:hypothetical protein